jgi:hypothetical protein
MPPIYRAASGSDRILDSLMQETGDKLVEGQHPVVTTPGSVLSGGLLAVQSYPFLLID